MHKKMCKIIKIIMEENNGMSWGTRPFFQYCIDCEDYKICESPQKNTVTQIPLNNKLIKISEKAAVLIKECNNKLDEAEIFRREQHTIIIKKTIESLSKIYPEIKGGWDIKCPRNISGFAYFRPSNAIYNMPEKIKEMEKRAAKKRKEKRVKALLKPEKELFDKILTLLGESDIPAFRARQILKVIKDLQ